MIREKAQNLLNLLKQGKGSATIFGSSYYDEEVLKIIEIATNECKSTVMKKDGTSKRYESDTYIHNIREIIQQLLTDKNTIKNSLVSTLTRIPGRDIPGIMTPIKIDKKVNEKGLPYVEIDKPFPENFKQIISGEIDREALTKKVIKPYIARIIRQNKQLSKKHFFSRIFSPFNRKEITNEELIMRFEEYLRQNTDLEEEKISNTAKYFVNNLLGNPSIIQDLINDETQGSSLEVVGEKNKQGYSGMLQNMSNNLFDILNSGSIPNPNDGLREIEDVYANLVGQLQALSIDPEMETGKIEEQIKNINRNINRGRQEYYSEENGYRTVDVGFRGKDAGLLKTPYVPRAMQLYSEHVAELLQKSDQMSEEEYIKEVAKLHFRFIQIHPFPDGNGRTARAISNMLLLEKNMTAVFPKQNKSEYINQMSRVRGVANNEYIKGLYTDQTICDALENERAYLLEEYIGMTCLGKNDLYKDRQITAELPVIDTERVD